MSRFLDDLALKLADSVIRYRWLVMIATLLLVMSAGSGMRLLQFANNYRVFFGKENPELLAFEELQATYTKNDNFLFVMRPSDGNVFQPKVGEAIEHLTERAWQIPYATRVDSLSNFQHTWANEDDLTVEDLLRNSASLSAEELEKKKQIALAEPLLKDNLLSPDADTTAVNVTLQYPEKAADRGSRGHGRRSRAGRLRCGINIRILKFAWLRSFRDEQRIRGIRPNGCFKTFSPLMYPGTDLCFDGHLSAQFRGQSITTTACDHLVLRRSPPLV